MKTQPSPRDQWLEENHPALFYTTRALDGDRKALRWLEGNTTALYHLCRAMGGDKTATDALLAADPVERDLIAEILDSEALLDRVRARHPEVDLVIRAAKGDGSATRRLRGKTAGLARVAAVLRALRSQGAAATDNDAALDETEAADVGLLVGEMHLARAEYERTVDAFDRALENQPSPDAYEGRAALPR